MYSLQRGKTPPPKMGVLCITLNCVWCWSSSFEVLESVGYIFWPLLPDPLSLGVAVPSRNCLFSLCFFFFANLFKYPTNSLVSSRGVMVSKLVLQTIVSRFNSHWVPHTFDLAWKWYYKITTLLITCSKMISLKNGRTKKMVRLYCSQSLN